MLGPATADEQTVESGNGPGDSNKIELGRPFSGFESSVLLVTLSDSQPAFALNRRVLFP
jgi:hypothetical protein